MTCAIGGVLCVAGREEGALLADLVFDVEVLGTGHGLGRSGSNRVLDLFGLLQERLGHLDQRIGSDLELLGGLGRLELVEEDTPLHVPGDRLLSDGQVDPELLAVAEEGSLDLLPDVLHVEEVHPANGLVGVGLDHVRGVDPECPGPDALDLDEGRTALDGSVGVPVDQPIVLGVERDLHVSHRL